MSVDDYPVPAAEEADEDGNDPFYASEREYEEQLDAYKAFQGRGKDGHRGKGVA